MKPITADAPEIIRCSVLVKRWNTGDTTVSRVDFYGTGDDLEEIKSARAHLDRIISNWRVFHAKETG